MKQFIFLLISSLLFNTSFSQPVVSARVSQSNYSSVDPDGLGPATGSVTIRFEVMASETVQADGFGIGFAFQSLNLMPAASPNLTPLGPLASLGWTASPNLPGNDLSDINYGGQIYNKSALIGYSQASTGLLMPITTSWAPILEVTYFTKSLSFPQGGNITMQPGSTLPQHSISADGGFTEYPLLSPGFPNPTALGAALPVLFTKFDAKCTNTGTLISWATAQEANTSHFEIERSTNGSSWATVGTVAAAGNSTVDRNYQQIDLNGGTALYRIKQIDKDGQFIYTNVTRTNCQVKNISSVIYPVPAKDILNVVIKSDRAVRTQLMVYDMQGKLVKRVDAAILSGNNNFRINLNGLSSGDYMLRTNDAAIEINKMFTIAR